MSQLGCFLPIFYAHIQHLHKSRHLEDTMSLEISLSWYATLCDIESKEDEYRKKGGLKEY